MEFSVLSPIEAGYWAAQTAVRVGHNRVARGMATTELQNVSFNIRYPWINAMVLPGRNANHAIGAFEACQLVGQASAPDALIRRIKAFERYSDQGIFWGAYGVRVHSQLARAERLLAEDSGTRQAVVSIYDGQRDLLADAKDIPCTLTIQFLWDYQERLGMRVNMRSNDVFLGLPYDLFQFSTLQCAMADALGVEPGNYTHTIGSMHAYDRDYVAIESVQNPGEPLAHETRYQRLWRGDSFGDISSRARDILYGYPLPDPTEFEQYLITTLNHERTTNGAL